MMILNNSKIERRFWVLIGCGFLVLYPCFAEPASESSGKPVPDVLHDDLYCSDLIICAEELRDAEWKLEEIMRRLQRTTVQARASSLRNEIEGFKRRIERQKFKFWRRKMELKLNATLKKVKEQVKRVSIADGEILFPGYGRYRNGQKLDGMLRGGGFGFLLLGNLYSYSNSVRLRNAVEQFSGFDFRRSQAEARYNESFQQTNSLLAFTAALYAANLLELAYLSDDSGLRFSYTEKQGAMAVMWYVVKY